MIVLHSVRDTSTVYYIFFRARFHTLCHSILFVTNLLYVTQNMYFSFLASFFCGQRNGNICALFLSEMLRQIEQA